jgi:serine/threonine-protein kinase
MTLLENGQVIRDTYEVERLLGEGAFAQVYRVKHRFLGRQAMKVFKRVGMAKGEIEELLGEAILLSRIGHPNIVRVFDANVMETARGTCGYFTMEYVAGGSLQKFWSSHGFQRIPAETSVDLMQQICRGMAQAHREKPPIVHRDIKPQNILVGYEADGLRARVGDFGLAKSVNPLTLMATAAGTLAFKPPEAFAEQKGDSCAADVWAIGATFYLMLTDRLPVNLPAGTTWGTAKLFDQTIIPPSQIQPGVDPELERMIMKCLAKKPEDRYQTAKELGDGLAGWKPGPFRRPQEPKAAPNGPSKSALGGPSPASDRQAQEMTKQAFQARKSGRLAEAADMMEEAFNKSPDLRTKYAQQVKLWRCGISM